MKVFLKIKDDKIYLYSNDIVRISEYINKPIVDQYIILNYKELAEYTKKLNRNGYICEVITKSSL
tara:strand:- start:404 stop:598 length:195 start_codon:yes stop_codon:yes gene_type:complete